MGSLTVFATGPMIMSIAETILGHVFVIGSTLRGMKENDETASRLTRRANEVKPAIDAIRGRNDRRVGVELLEQLERSVWKIRFELEKYAEMSKMARAWKRKSIDRKFLKLSNHLTEAVNAILMENIRRA